MLAEVEPRITAVFTHLGKATDEARLMIERLVPDPPPRENAADECRVVGGARQE